MKFEHAALPIGHAWSSPFVRWQGALADVSSLDLAAAVTGDALAARGVDRATIDTLVLGTTVPQPSSFYAVPWLAARLDMPGVSGPHLSQACATSVTCLVAAALMVEADAQTLPLVVTADRTSNGPLLIYPRSAGMGGSPAVENWVLDSFAADPNTGKAMVATAENVARDGRMTRQALDELTLMRWRQYQDALADDRRAQRSWMQPVSIARGKGKTLVVETDEGVHPYSAEALAKLAPVQSGGVVTFGSQTHPADGCAGAIVCRHQRAAQLAAGTGTVRLLAAGFARAAKAEMPKAATTAAERALASAGLSIGDVKLVQTHNPFAVNDLWFVQQTGFDPQRMNVRGCSLIYGHPQGPTGLRGIVELVHALRERGGGIGLFTGCAAGDTGAALVLRVD
ncbi:MAG: acetyl-CoA acetyltransferase [Burkholderiaceae bacterium]|jgi:acetyl-CoA C-acetyltransferase|nr:MAG: acetyl-CoA acetyltransferase [Burkholderiaceae bacterium]